MKFNDDSLMLFDLDSCLDYGAYDTVDSNGLNYSNQFVDFGCDELEQFSNLTPTKTSLIDEIDLFGNSTNEPDFTSEFCDFTDFLFNSSFNNNFTNSPLSNSSNSSALNSSPFNPFSTHSNNAASPLNTSNDSKQQSEPMESSQDRRDVRKKLLDMTQRKLTNTLCYDNKLRNQVLLKSILKREKDLKSVSPMSEENLLGIQNKQQVAKFENLEEFTVDKQDKLNRLINKYDKDDVCKDQDTFRSSSSARRKRNFKSNLSNSLNEREIFEEKNSNKKQKLCHLDDSEKYFTDENNYNDDLTLNNLANCFIKLKTQHSHD